MQAAPTPPNWLLAHLDAVLGWVLAIIIAFVTLYYSVFRNKKALSYSVSCSPIAVRNGDLPGSIVILYDVGDGYPQEVQDGYIVVLRIKNTGRLEITKDDFNAALTFTMPSRTKILSVAVGECHPENLAQHIFATLSSNQQTLMIAPALLNSGDMLSFSLVAADAPEKLGSRITCAVRIRGLRDVTHDLDLASDWRPDWLQIIITSLAMTLALFGILAVTPLFSGPRTAFVTAVTIVGALIVLLTLLRRGG